MMFAAQTVELNSMPIYDLLDRNIQTFLSRHQLIIIGVINHLGFIASLS